MKGPVGDELVTNGTFTGNADGWIVGPDWSYNSNHIEAVDDQGYALAQDWPEDLPVILGVFEYSIDVGGTTGSIDLYPGDQDPITIPAGSGTYTFTAPR